MAYAQAITTRLRHIVSQLHNHMSEYKRTLHVERTVTYRFLYLNTLLLSMSLTLDIPPEHAREGHEWLDLMRYR